jgi:DNA-binding NtrC family response regulator
VSGGRLTLTDAGAPGGAPLEPRPFLFHVLESHRPVASGARYCLDGVARVIFGRGAGPAAREGDALHVFCADPYASTTHATLRRAGAGWRIDDSSKNGTFVNGARVAGAATVGDGAVVEIAGSFFVLRAALASTPDDRRDVHADELPAELATLLPPVARTFAAVERVAASPVSVVLVGETGTGKEVVARAIHRLSRRGGPFVALSCGAIHAALIEPELLGAERGALPGLEERPGVVRRADGGTLLLDEVGDLAPAAQAALLRVLQEREVVPVGGARPIPVDVRVVTASREELARLVAEGRLRPDLEARLAGVVVTLPPLEGRLEDLGLFVSRILRRALPTLAGHVSFEKPAARALLSHAWPKNVRELEQALTSAIALSGSRPIGLEHLPAALQGATLDEPAPAAADELQRELARRLGEHDGNVSAVARAMGKTRKQIQRWLKRYRLDAVTFRKD